MSQELAPIEHLETGITRASLQKTANQLELLEEFVSTVLRANADFGLIPGTDRPTLLKPGAANVISAFQCHSEPYVDHHEIDHDQGFENYIVHVDVVHTASGKVVARGFGSCNSHERKYRYRQGERQCPGCSQPSIIKGKAEYGGGWLCWAKKGGCGAKFPDGDRSIEGQNTGQIENPDPLDQSNTYLKMSIKRAEVDAALRLPGVARFFTQDLDEIMGEEAPEMDTQPPAEEARPPQPKPAKEKPQANPVEAIRQACTAWNKSHPDQPIKGPEIEQGLKALYNIDSPAVVGLAELTPEQALDMWELIGKGDYFARVEAAEAIEAGVTESGGE